MCCPKCNEITICNSNIQSHFYKKNMVLIIQIFCIHTLTKVFRHITAYREKSLKYILLIYIALSKIKFMHVNQMYISTFPIKNGINSINIFHTDSYNFFPVHYDQWGKTFKAYFNVIYIAQNIMKFKYVIHMYNSMLGCTGSQKRFLLYYELCLETAENEFSIVFQGLFPLY